MHHAEREREREREHILHSFLYIIFVLFPKRAVRINIRKTVPGVIVKPVSYTSHSCNTHNYWYESV